MGKPEWENGHAAQMWRVRQQQNLVWQRWADREAEEAGRQIITLSRDQYAERKDDDA